LDPKTGAADPPKLAVEGTEDLGPAKYRHILTLCV